MMPAFQNQQYIVNDEMSVQKWQHIWRNSNFLIKSQTKQLKKITYYYLHSASHTEIPSEKRVKLWYPRLSCHFYSNKLLFQVVAFHTKKDMRQRWASDEG